MYSASSAAVEIRLREWSTKPSGIGNAQVFLGNVHVGRARIGAYSADLRENSFYAHWRIPGTWYLGLSAPERSEDSTRMLFDAENEYSYCTVLVFNYGIYPPVRVHSLRRGNCCRPALYENCKICPYALRHPCGMKPCVWCAGSSLRCLSRAAGVLLGLFLFD